MKYILVAGGSGGHIYPCLSLAQYLNEHGEDVLLIGSTNGMEEDIYKKSNLPCKFLDINKKKIKSFASNYSKIKEIYKEFKPNGVILFGNYISFGFAIVSRMMNIPVFLHEQNIIYGKANKLLGVLAKRIYLSLPVKKNIYKYKSLVVGNPKCDFKKRDKAFLKKGINVFVVMGSLGSSTINRVLLELITIAREDINYHIVTGKKHYDKFISNVKNKDNVFVYPYLDSLLDYTCECNLFVSRSGATTLLEIINYKIPSILIPSPYVANNHQYKNAMYLVNNKGAYMLLEKDLNAYKLNKMIEDIVFSRSKVEELKKNLTLLETSDSAKKIHEDLLKYAR